MARNKKTTTQVESFRHKDKRANIPTEELRDFLADEELAPKTMLYRPHDLPCRIAAMLTTRAALNFSGAIASH